MFFAIFFGYFNAKFNFEVLFILFDKLYCREYNFNQDKQSTRSVKEEKIMNEKEKYLFEERLPDTDDNRKSTFSMKIGGTVYDVTTHLKTEGKRTVLNQFKALLLANQYL